MIVIGLDIGTTSICGVALELHEGRVVHVLTQPNDSSVGGTAGTEQDAEQIMRIVQRILGELLTLSPNAVGIGIAGQMHGILYTGADGHAVSPLYTWQDRRGLRPSSDGIALAERLTGATGYPVYTGYGFVTHAALLDQGEVPVRATALCTIADYAVMRLTGRIAPVMDASNAASLGFFDVERGRFNADALAAAGCTPDWMPQIHRSMSKVGDYLGRIPVFHAIGDNQASILGSVKELPSSLLLNIGTGGQLSVFTEQFTAVRGLETRPFPGGGYLLVGASLAGGKAYAMLERFFRAVIEAFVGPEAAARELYAAMEFLADRKKAEKDKLIVHSQFYGTREDPGRRASIEGIGPSNLTPEHLIAGFLEGIMEELYGFFARLPGPVKDRVETLIGSGNGIRKNRHLRSVCEKRFGMRLQLSAVEEEAAVGAALHAAVGAGIASDHMSVGGMLPEYAGKSS
ncbi:sedoheptulokinase [Paenibacillus allorhizosphaerae]|uniref:Xylulose kinase n=1 Tax=Paenibacillus allorhizosphaerae TaxID=2849866 RepID=A0ABN7THM5_9BACL|nr:FGGY family carbohydrate kinase [Paenibacillus allorhizosphaerae]CAG7628446.1 Xylulose kinase [Paenibacillus allorhizosphaerae]